MSDHEQDDELLVQSLGTSFAALRVDDGARVPAFGPMLERAAQTARAETTAPRVSALRLRQAAVGTPRWRSARTLAWATPLLVAAGLAVVVFSPERLVQRAADQEFEAIVGEWTRTAIQTTQLPTDGLLSLPGSEYLRTLPAIGGGGDVSGTRRPS